MSITPKIPSGLGGWAAKGKELHPKFPPEKEK